MDTKKEVKKGPDSHNLMDKLLAKFKMTKHGGEDKASESKSGKNACENEPPSLAESKPQVTRSKSKAIPEKIIEFSENLQQLLENVQALKDYTLITYDFPELNKKLEKEAIELRDLYRNIQQTALDIERLQKHRYLVIKEKCLASKKLDKLKEEEILELEAIIYAYAKPLYSKWESIKHSQKVEVVENFLNEVTGKHKAIEILQELVRRKLGKMSKKFGTSPFPVKKNISSTNMTNKTQKQDKNIPPWNLTLPDTDKFNQSIDKVIRGPPDRDILKMNRRKRQKLLREERRRVNHENSSSSNTDNSGGLELHLVPIDNFRNEEVEEDFGGAKQAVATNGVNRTSPVINIELMYDTDSVSLSSSDLTLEHFGQSGNPEQQQDLQREMRTVLQALFGEVRHIPQIRSYPSRNRYNNNNDTGNDLRSPRSGSN